MFKNILLNAKFLYQRLTRGWDDREIWSLDYSLAKWILPRLVEFTKKEGYGIPLLEGYDLDDTNEYKKAKAEWSRIQYKIIIAFRHIIKDGEGEILSQLDYKEMEEGLDLFRKYLRNLWF